MCSQMANGGPANGTSLSGMADIEGVRFAHAALLGVAVVNIKAIPQADRLARLENKRIGRQFSIGIRALAERAHGEQTIVAHVKPRLSEILRVVEYRNSIRLPAHIAEIIDPFRFLSPAFLFAMQPLG